MFEGFWLRYVVEVIGTYRDGITMRLWHTVYVRIYGVSTESHPQILGG
jgi:hypothetical protein